MVVYHLLKHAVDHVRMKVCKPALAGAESVDEGHSTTNVQGYLVQLESIIGHTCAGLFRLRRR